MSNTKPFQVEGVEFTDDEAFALAELCRRITFADCRGNAASERETYAMIAATNKVRQALALAGFSVR